MAITAQTRTQLIGLSVAMLGSAPGTDRLNHWVADVDDGMSVDDLANHIAETEAFQDKYPTFLTNMEFAEAFLGSVMYGVSGDLMTAAVELVSGMLDGGLSRGSLALAVVDALHDIAMQGMDHDAYADLGMSAMAFANKVEVATHYTLDSRMADPSESVLEGVTNEADSVMMAIDAIDNPPAPPVEPETGQRFVLTPTIDDFTGGSLDDTFVAQPLQGADGLFNATLNSFDSIDGGDGTDTIHVFGVNPNDTLRLGAEDIMNVENVVISTVGSIDADLSDWAGLEMVSLDRFGREDETMVEVIVDGAMVSSERAFDGNVTIVGATGAVDIEAGAGSVVHVGSAGHTGSVMVKGGASVAVNNGASSGNMHSMTVTSVSVDGVVRDKPESTGERSDTRSHYNLRTDFDSYVLAPNGDRVELTVGSGGTAMEIKVSKAEGSKDAVNVTNSAGEAITHDDGFTLQYDPVSGNLMWMRDAGTAADTDVPDLPTTNVSMEREEYFPELEAGGGSPTLKVHSDSIETVALHNTTAIALIHNNSKMADGKDMPEDLSVMVDMYGDFNANGTVKEAGKLCIGGTGSAENIDIMVAGASVFDLASGKVKALDISGEGRLVLGVDNFKEDADPSDDGVSKTLESVTVSGAVNLSMNGLSGMSKLKMIDASESSGDNSFKSQAGSAPAGSDQLSALTMVMGGTGKDSVTLSTSVTGKLESVDTGDGDDSVTITGMLRNGGLMVDLGAGNDSYSGTASNARSRVDGGDGTDTLHLTTAEGSTYKDAEGDTHSIYTGFETLNVASGNGNYDIEQLGIVNDVLVTKSTMGNGVTLENMADGMGIRVSGTWGFVRSSDNEATIVHELAERKSGEARASGELDVNLTAVGRNDTRSSTEGEAELTLTTGDDIEVININSSASPHSKSSTPANQRARASDYVNELDLTSSVVEELIIDGNAKLEITGSTLAALDLVDAQGNSGGVTFNANDPDGDDTPNALTQDLELVGGSGADNLTGGDGDDEITGGLGGDTLTGGGGDDEFIIDAADESMAVFYISNGVNTLLMGSHDTIVGFDLASDKIDLSRGLLNAVSGQIKNTTGDTSEWDDWMVDDMDTADPSDDTFVSQIGGTGGAANLAAFVGDGNGLFESRDLLPEGQRSDIGNNMTTNQYSIAVINQDDGNGALAEGIWLLFDVDGNGDYDAGTDMVIFLQGTTFSASDWDSGANGAGIFI